MTTDYPVGKALADALVAVRELVQRWVIESNWRSGGVGATYKRCADELESALAKAPAVRVEVRCEECDDGDFAEVCQYDAAGKHITRDPSLPANT